MASSPDNGRQTDDPRHWSRLHRRGRRRAFAALLLLLPWSWFLIRDSWSSLNAGSVAMPALAAVGGILLLAGAALTRRLLPLLAALSLLGMTLVTVILPLLPQPAGTITKPMTVASANIYQSNATPKAAATGLAATHADILVAVEVPDGFAALLRSAVGSSHPYQVQSQGIVIRSAFPIVGLPVPSRLSPTRVLMASVRTPQSGTFTLFAVHAVNPIQESSFAFQQSFIDRLDQSARERQAVGPVVIAGDLNLSDRTHGYRILSSDFRDAMRAGSWAGDTYVQGIWRYAFLRIDHLFVSRTWCAADPSRFDIPGSDHLGIRATIGPCG